MFYTQPNNDKRIFVIEKDKPLKQLDIDNCFLKEEKNCFVTLPVECLFEQKPFYPFSAENTTLYVNKEKVSPCSLCADRLNSLTKNCSWGNGSECKFKPAQYIPEGNLSEVRKRTFVKPNLTLPRTFSTNFDYDEIDFKRIDNNKEAWKIRKNLGEYIEKKQTSECNACLFECSLNTYRIQKNCRYTIDDLKQAILPKITKEFGSIDNFLQRILYTGKFGLIKVSDKKRSTEWVVGLPEKDDYYLIKTYHPYQTIKVNKTIIEKTFTAGMLPPEKEKIALLGYTCIEVFGRPFKHWYRNKHLSPAYFCNSSRFIGVSPIKDGIKLHYIEVGYNHRELQSIEFTNVKDLVSRYWQFRELNKNR